MKNRFFGTCLLLLATSAYAKPLYDTGPVDISMQALMADYNLTGSSIRLSRDGNVHMENHYGNYAADTRIPIASASKWLSALVIARLVEKNQMQWNDTIGQWMPDAPANKRDISLAQLFSHTSGLPGNETTGCLSNRFITLDNCARQILELPLESTPGSSFSYGGNSMQVAGRLAEIASGKNWNLLFYDELVVPLGLSATDFATASTQDGYVWTGNPRIAGGVRSTQSDYARALDMVLAGGLNAGVNYLGDDTLAFMAFNQTAGKIILSTPSPENFGYGIGQWVEAVDSRGITTRVSSPGAFGVTPWVDWAAGNNGIVFVRDQRTRIVDGLNVVQVEAISALSKRHYIKPPIQSPQKNRSRQIPSYANARTITGRTDEILSQIRSASIAD